MATIRSLRQGCYLLNYKPKASPFYVTYDGTLRVEAHQDGRTASGDLYQRPFSWICRPTWPPICFPALPPGPNPANGIPIQARDRSFRRFSSSDRSLTSISLSEMTFSISTYPSSVTFREGDRQNQAERDFY